MTERVLNATCPYCKKQFKGTIPNGYGILKLKCPKCSKEMRIPIEKKEYRLPDGKVGEQQKHNCPNCSKEINYTPQKEGDIQIQCKCGAIIKQRIAGKTVVLNDKNGIKGHLVQQKKNIFKQNKIIHLRPGDNVIGRYDEDSPSDIPIKGDPTMSRRSIKINVNPLDNKGFVYCLTVLKDNNPVLVNNKRFHVKDSIYLTNGDTIQLGNTIFKFEVEKNKKS